jgi:hypothetical protein
LATVIVTVPLTAAVIVILIRLDERDLHTLAIVALVLAGVLLVGLLFIGIILGLAWVLQKFMADDRQGDLRELVVMSQVFRGLGTAPPPQQQLPAPAHPGYAITSLVEEAEDAEVAIE